jgi:hypothetical protein
VTTHNDYATCDNINALYNMLGQRAEDRAVWYMKRFGMSEKEACQAAVAWWKNMKRQRRMRYAHGTGAHDHVREDHRQIR